jgi:hypothetical protein
VFVVSLWCKHRDKHNCCAARSTAHRLLVIKNCATRTCVIHRMLRSPYAARPFGPFHGPGDRATLSFVVFRGVVVASSWRSTVPWAVRAIVYQTLVPPRCQAELGSEFKSKRSRIKRRLKKRMDSQDLATQTFTASGRVAFDRSREQLCLSQCVSNAFSRCWQSVCLAITGKRPAKREKA